MIETDERFHVGPSTIPGAGMGLFAGVPLATGDRLRVVGVLIPRDSVADRCTSYADAYKLRVGDDRLLIPVGWAALVNHRVDGNVRKVVEADELYLEAIRPIPEGDEITFRYHEYAASRLGTSQP